MNTEQYRLAFPAYRVFIFGMEISHDVLSVNMSYHDGAAPNTCQITLANELDKYVVTTDDIIKINKLDRSNIGAPWLTKETDPWSIFNNSHDIDRTPDIGILQPEKAQILAIKHVIEQDFDKNLREDIFGNPLVKWATSYFDNTIKKYPIADGCSIFHAMDPVRIFFRDPYDPSNWYHMFCGFVSDIVDMSNENNVKTLTILVEDPTKLFRYTRTVRNPGIMDASKVITDSDLKVQSFWTNPYHDMTLLEVFYTVVFGPDKASTASKINGGIPTSDSIVTQKVESAGGTSVLNTRLRGIGHFSIEKSKVATVGPSSTDDNGIANIGSGLGIRLLHLGNDLSKWQMLLDHKVVSSDIVTMATDDDFRDNQKMQERKNAVVDSSGAVNVDSVISLIGSRPDLYPVDGGRLMVLIPRSMGTQNNQILLKDIIQSYPMQSDFASAGQVLVELIERIQFCMYCSPRGDLVVEPPLHDFSPSDFGMNTIRLDSEISSIDKYAATDIFSDLNRSVKLFGTSNNDQYERGPYGHNFLILKRDTISWDVAQVDEKIYTVAVTKYAIFKNWGPLPYSDIVGDVSLVPIPELIPLYGIRQAPLTPRGYLYTREAAKLYAEICLNRLNADAHTMHVVHVPNIKLWLNRPIYIQGRNAIATTKQISHSLTWGAQGDMHTGTDLNAIRTWKGEVDSSGNMIFTTINGTGSKLLDYALIFKMAPVPEPKNIGTVNAGE